MHTKGLKSDEHTRVPEDIAALIEQQVKVVELECIVEEV